MPPSWELVIRLGEKHGGVYMVIVGAASGDILAFDFGRLYDICTFRRWTNQIICYRSFEGASGMMLIFPTESTLDRFETACDRNLPSHTIETPAPTLEQLRDLGLIAAPRVVGSFLLEGRRTETATRRPQQESALDAGDEQHVPFLLSDWARTIARPPPAFALNRAEMPSLDLPVRNRSPDPVTVSAVHEEDDTEEGSDTSSIGDLSDLSDLDISDIDSDDLAELVHEVDEMMENFDVLTVTRRYQFPGSFV
ncbi:hypothetical protein C8T65DRAFT_738324 [Cerioporus squamosus]|nr:hypothetical protein C8T65DRAFT_738324 [Cerioporus squamosus]